MRRRGNIFTSVVTGLGTKDFSILFWEKKTVETCNILLFWFVVNSLFLFIAKMRRRGNISLKLVAQMLTKAGFNHIITVDMHSKESQGFFDCAIDNLRASPFLIQYIQESVSNNWKLNFCHHIFSFKNKLWASIPC